MNPISIQYWLPRVVESGVPSPITHMIAPQCELGQLLDGKTPKGLDTFLFQVQASANAIGYPCFLRFGEGSGKHQWASCCIVEGPEDLLSKIANTLEDQALKDLDRDLVVIRKLIETKPLFKAFQDFPVTREFRFFARAVMEEDGTEIAGKFLSFPKLASVEIHHIQPYWPADAIEGHTEAHESWRDILKEASFLTKEEFDLLSGYCDLVIREFQYTGHLDWSIDFLQDVHGNWWLTDMALTSRSYRWEPDFNVTPF